MSLKQTVPLKNQKPLLYAKDFYDWPKYWMGLEEDLAVGVNILEEFILFVEFLEQKKLARSTIKKYMSNLSVLGSEIIRRIQDNENQRHWSAKNIILSYIDNEGGPLPHCWDPNNFTEARYLLAYDSTCRIFYKFLKN